jgi:hypothetical protein
VNLHFLIVCVVESRRLRVSVEQAVKPGKTSDACQDSDGFGGDSDSIRIRDARFTIDLLVDLTVDAFVDIADLIRFMELYQLSVGP